MNNISSYASEVLNGQNPFKNLKLENYKYAQLHKIDKLSNFNPVELNLKELSEICSEIKSQDMDKIDLKPKIDDWTFKTSDSYFRVSSLTSKETRLINLDNFNQNNLLLDLNKLNENIYIKKFNEKFQTLVLLNSNTNNVEPKSIFIDLDENANLEVIHLCLSNDKSFLYFQSNQADNSDLSLISFQSNNHHIRNEYYASLGTNCNFNISGINLKNKGINDNFSFIQHLKPSTSSNEIFKSIVNDGAITNFQGKIYVDSIAQKTDGYQMSRSLLLDDISKANNKPELEIYADDVKCSHGSTISKLNQNQIYYFNSRGITTQEAIKILKKAFLIEVLDLYKNQELKDFSLNLLDNLL